MARKTKAMSGSTGTHAPSVRPARSGSFPIVGIGASAGGLEAFASILAHVAAEPGAAFVFVQHLDPKHESLLTEILSRSSKVPVTEARDGTRVRPNQVYVIPPNANLAIAHGTLEVTPRPATHGQHMPVDVFLRSLAEDQKNKAIGVVLSGTASPRSSCCFGTPSAPISPNTRTRPSGGASSVAWSCTRWRNRRNISTICTDTPMKWKPCITTS